MRLPDWRDALSSDPVLKAGVVAMAFALGVAALVAGYVALERDDRKNARPAGAVAAAESEPLVRSDPGIDPIREERVATPEPDGLPPDPRDEPREDPAPGPREARANGPEETLPGGVADWPEPSEEEVRETNAPRRYDLPRGAAFGLTLRTIGLYDVPVLRSNTQRALDRGLVHLRGASMPWSTTPERNVYVAGHRLGWPGTGSHLVFYRLDEVSEGDEIVLKEPDGRRYPYRVTATFVVRPEDTWVTGRIRERDMLTLQTCTGPNWSKRLIVRAERV